MLKRTISRVLGLPFIALTVFSAPAFAQESADGKKLYYDHGCYSCHGFQGKGTHVLRANNLFPKPPILLRGQAPFLVSEDVFRAYLRLRGDVAPKQPSVLMPNYPATTLDDAAVAALYAYISAFTPDEPPLEEIETMQWILEHAAEQ
jgi:cytochrome c553